MKNKGIIYLLLAGGIFFLLSMKKKKKYSLEVPAPDKITEQEFFGQSKIGFPDLA